MPRSSSSSMIRPMFETPTVAQLRITLAESSPPIWRRLLVLRGTTLGDLHHIIQAAFGWRDSHLHEFEIGGLRFGDAKVLNEDEYDGMPRAFEEAEVRLSDFRWGAPPFIYLYDFGDSWTHEVVIEELLGSEEGRVYPACIEGARSGPPEDVGGISGYGDLLEVLADRDHPEHKNMQRWAGRSFDPEKFDLAKTDRAVRSAVRSARRRRLA